MCMEQEEYSKMHHISSKAFSHYQNDGAMRWMARWQEQEDGNMRNFSIIELAKIGEERMRGRVPFISLEAKGSGLDQCQVLV